MILVLNLVLLTASLNFAVLDKVAGRDVLHRWKPKSANSLYYWPCVDEWVRARIALEDTNAFVVICIDDAYELRAFVCNKHRRHSNIIDACIWSSWDTADVRKRTFEEFRTWHARIFPDAVLGVGTRLTPSELVEWRQPKWRTKIPSANGHHLRQTKMWYCRCLPKNILHTFLKIKKYCIFFQMFDQGHVHVQNASKHTIRRLKK